MVEALMDVDESPAQSAIDGITFVWTMYDSDPLMPEVLKRIKERGWMPLSPTTSRILCAVKDNELVGFHVLQLVPHCEPLWVDESQRGTGLAGELSARMLKFMQDIEA